MKYIAPTTTLKPPQPLSAIKRILLLPEETKNKILTSMQHELKEYNVNHAEQTCAASN